MKEILLKIHLEELPEGVFLATSEELPGLITQGRTVAETLEIAQDVARKLIESYQEHGDELPSA
jgi:antitoxin HicB